MNITFDDPRLTAYALDQLDEAGRSDVATAVRNSPEYRNEVEEIIRAAAMFRDALESESMPALATLQRDAIEAELNSGRSNSKLLWIRSAAPDWLWKTGLAAFVIFVLSVIPFPQSMASGLQSLSQRASLDTAYGMLRLTGAPVSRAGMALALPGGTRFILAPDCPPVTSTIVLLVASVLIGNLFLRSPWKRLLLIFFVIPVVVLKGGLHLFILTELCLRLNSNDAMTLPFVQYLGPISFAMILIPFGCLLLWLRKPRSRRKSL